MAYDDIISRVSFTGATNLSSLFHTATQSSTYYIDAASNAVDDDVKTRSITAYGDFHPWWAVQLAYPVWVTHVEIVNMVYKGKKILSEIF